jgi:outer membrane protein OmpA-like peptidoglycan-associated protein
MIIFGVACVCWLPGQGQQVVTTKSVLQLADQYFAAGEYYTAAYLYEQYLNPLPRNTKDQVFPVYTNKRKPGPDLKKISRTAILYKQAESYRLANYWLQADAAYEKCPDHIDALYWRAVCERSLGAYAAAEEKLLQYTGAPDTNKQYTEAAEKEWAALQFISKQLARPDTILFTISKIKMAGSHEKGNFAVVPVSGDRYLVSSTKTDSVEVKGTNPHNSHLFFAVMKKDSLAQPTPLALSSTLLNNQGAASISANGNRIYFTQWQKVNGRTVSAIFVITKSNGGWSAPQLLEQVNTNGYNSKQPFCTADGKYLYFASDRPGGAGGFDIWYTPLQADGSAGEPVHTGPVINTERDEQAPFYQTSSNTLVFSTNGRLGMGAFDLFAAKGSGIAWSKPNNMGYPVNSSRDDIYFFAPENKALLAEAIIGSDRGSGCCMETYRVTKTPKNNLLTGLVLDNKTHKPITGADIVLTTPDGKTRQTSTDITGNYIFDNVDNSLNDFTVKVTKPSFKDTAAVVMITKTDDTNLLTDRLYNTDIYLDKMFVLRPENVVTVFFDFDMHNLKTEAVRKLDSVYNILLEYPSATLQISGYTDGKGSVEYNKILSDKRARACADYFIQKGIPAGRITFESFGACCPLEMELINGRDNPDGRSRNRRALINITKE